MLRLGTIGAPSIGNNGKRWRDRAGESASPEIEADPGVVRSCGRYRRCLARVLAVDWVSISEMEPRCSAAGRTLEADRLAGTRRWRRAALPVRKRRIVDRTDRSPRRESAVEDCALRERRPGPQRLRKRKRSRIDFWRWRRTHYIWRMEPEEAWKGAVVLNRWRRLCPSCVHQEAENVVCDTRFRTLKTHRGRTFHLHAVGRRGDDVMRDRDRSGWRDGFFNLGPFWGSRLGCAVLFAIAVMASFVPYLIKVALGL